ncbi:uncharacterized protein NPIL_226211 [Nephila pilipes]|uniref:Uncharacterized protein n=1 Tax=Nephila pilipes TaxID=299642 RepID=A0A8X6QW41_NEPPI|nr:uncharacterized protein NPIL_226211 [Nephila pilipes]
MSVRGVILSAGETKPLFKLKAGVIVRCGERKSQEIRRLIAGEELGDRKLLELFHVMRLHSESHNVAISLFLDRFLQQLPPLVQSIFTSTQPLIAQKVAEVAYRFLEAKYCKMKFQHMLYLDQMCPFNSNYYSSPFHMVPEKKGSNDWQPVGDYRALNVQTTTGRNQKNVPHIKSDIYISKFSTDIRYVVGKDNKIANALSRTEIDEFIKPPTLNCNKFT